MKRAELLEGMEPVKVSDFMDSFREPSGKSVDLQTAAQIGYAISCTRHSDNAPRSIFALPGNRDELAEVIKRVEAQLVAFDSPLSMTGLRRMWVEKGHDDLLKTEFVQDHIDYTLISVVEACLHAMERGIGGQRGKEARANNVMAKLGFAELGRRFVSNSSEAALWKLPIGSTVTPSGRVERNGVIPIVRDWEKTPTGQARARDIVALDFDRRDPGMPGRMSSLRAYDMVLALEHNRRFPNAPVDPFRKRDELGHAKHWARQAETRYNEYDSDGHKLVREIGGEEIYGAILHTKTNTANCLDETDKVFDRRAK